MAPVGGQQGLDDLDAFPKGVAQVSPVPVSGLHDLAQRDRGTREFLADGSAQETVLVKDPHLGEITMILLEDDRLVDVGHQREGHIAVPHKSDPIATHDAWLSHGQ